MYIDIYRERERNEKPNRTGRAEPKRTVEFFSRPEPDAERNRTLLLCSVLFQIVRIVIVRIVIVRDEQ